MGSTVRVILHALLILASLVMNVLKILIVINAVTILKTLSNLARFSFGIMLSDLPWGLKKDLLKHYNKVLLRTCWAILSFPSYVLGILTSSSTLKGEAPEMK